MKTTIKLLLLGQFLLAVTPRLGLAAPLYAWTNFVGQPGGYGNADGPGSAARFNNPYGVTVDRAGNLYVADSYNQTIRKVTADGMVTTLAGLAGQRGTADGAGSAARFGNPSGIAVDDAGTLYVAETLNHTIRKITADGVVTTLAGLAGSYGTNDGPGSVARFDQPRGVAVDDAGNVYVADLLNCMIRKVTASGEVTTLAGRAGNPGSANGTGSAAQFSAPSGVAVDSAGNVYVADMNNHTLRKVTAGGEVTTLAGLAGIPGATDSTGSGARFNNPFDVAVDSDGNVYVADGENHTLRKVTASGVVTTLAGSPGNIGSADGTGSAARFFYPYGVAADSTGILYVADTWNNTIRKVTADRGVTTLAGRAASFGSADGTGSTARFAYPASVATDSAGNLYVADSGNDTLRKVTAGGLVTTLAGLAGYSGSANGTGSAARFYDPSGVATDSEGNVYVTELGNATVRKVTPAGVVTTLAGRAGNSGTNDGTGNAARFYRPLGAAADSAGNVYVADSENHTLRKVTAVGVVTTLAGLAGSHGSTDGTGSEARFYRPSGVAVDSADNLYVADRSNHTIRKVTTNGVVTTLAGLAGNAGSADGTGSAARFYAPYSVAVDSAGNVYVADSWNHTIRKVTSDGAVTTIGGMPGSAGGADGAGSAAWFSYPEGVAVDGAGNLYVADRANNRISKGTLVLPNLMVMRAGNSVIVSWPTTVSGTLEQNSELSHPAGWVSSGFPITTVNGTNTITVTLPAANLVFRLKQ